MNANQDRVGCRLNECSLSFWTAIIAGLSLHSFYSFFRDDGKHNQRCDRIGPPQPEYRVQDESDKENRGKICAELRLLRVRVHRGAIERIPYFAL